jgi:hypothetical protein
MRSVSKAALVFLLVLGPIVLVGCGDDSTGPSNPPPSAGEHLWSKRLGDQSGQWANSVAIDVSGNVIVTGYFDGTVDFGGGLLTSTGSDIFAAKFGSDGAHLWSKRFGDSSIQIAHAVAVDASGNVIVTGSFHGVIDFGGGPLTSIGNWDIFIVRLGPDGTHIWSKRFGDDAWGGYKGAAVAIDALEAVIVTGSLCGAVDFGGGPLTGAGNGDIFVAKFASDGAHLWSKAFGDGSGANIGAVAVDAMGNVIVTGCFDGTADFGGGALTSAGGNDIFVVEFGSDGTHLWSKRFGDTSGQYACGAAVDPSGNAFVSGTFLGSVDFGGGVLTSSGNSDVFVTKFGSDGSHLWSKRFGDGDIQAALAIAVDASGKVIVTGEFRGAIDFGGGTLTSSGLEDIFVAKFGFDGSHLWSKRFGDGTGQFPRGVTVDASERLVITGWYLGTVDFGGGPLTSAGCEDIFIAKFGP